MLYSTGIHLKMNQYLFGSVLRQSPLLLTFITITSINYFTIYNFTEYLRIEESALLHYLGNVVSAWYIILSTLLIYSLVILSIGDPGSLESLNCGVNAPNGFKSTIRYCNKCIGRKWKPPRAHHCTTCNICIFRMDHHCTLVNNCIGYSNQKIYILFLFYSLCSTLLTVAISLFLLSNLKIYSRTNGPFNIKSALLVNIVANVTVFLATVAFFADQIDYIASNSSLVELLSNKRGKKTEFINNFKMIFGENKCLWLLPSRNLVRPNFSEELYEIIDYPDYQHFSEIRSADKSEQLKFISELSNVNKITLKNE